MPTLSDTPGYRIVAEDIKNIWHVVSKAAAYTASHNDLVLVDASGAGVTITLPTVSALMKGMQVGIKKTDSSANVVTVATPGSETIDGANTLSLTTQYESYILISDGSNWHIL